MQPASLPQHTASPSCDPGAPFCLGPSGRAARSSTDLSSLPVQCTWSGVAGDIRLLLLTPPKVVVMPPKEEDPRE